MSEQFPNTSRQSETSPSTWREVWALMAHFGPQRWLAFPLIGFGVAAAIAETVGTALAVLFLFALLDQGEQVQQSGGLLAELFIYIEAFVGTSTSLIALVFFAIIMLTAVLVYASNVISAIILNRVAERMRNLVHELYITVGYRYLQKREHGELMHTLGTESWNVSEAFHSLSRIAVNLCAVIVLGIGIFALSWSIGLTALLGAGAAMLITWLLSIRIRRLSRRTLAANQILADRMLISLTGMRTLRIFARGPEMLTTFNTISEKVRVLAIKSELVQSLIGPIGQVANLGVLLLIVLVASFTGTEVPTIIASVLLLMRLQPYLLELETQRLTLANLSASLRDVRQTLELHNKPWPTQGDKPFKGMTHSMRFDNVSFAHDSDGAKSVDGVSFEIPKGQVTMIAGASGSGKSTLLNLLLRLYEPDAGQITVDGTDLQKFTHETWLGQIGIAGQDVELIDGTVLQNIQLSQLDASVEDIRAVCEAVEMMDDLDKLPAGLDTKIGASGLNFSGGQRQRLGIARALLRDPDILLLDEATSALEQALEDRILQRIQEKMAGKTIVFISHRASHVLGAVNLVRIENGRVAKASA